MVQLAATVRNASTRRPGGKQVTGTLIEQARAWAAEPERRGFIFLADGEHEAAELPYGLLDQRARAIAGMLQQRLDAGKPALLLYLPGPDYVAAFLGCLYAGVLPVPAYPARGNRLARLTGIVADSRAALALTTVAELPGMQSALPGMQWLPTDDIADKWADKWVEPAPTPETPAFLQYTSGSTTAPRGVIVTHGNLMNNSAHIHRCLNHGENTGIVHWLPLYHDLGLIGGIVQTIYAGGWCVFMPPMVFLQNPYLWLQAISRYRVYASGGPNFAYDLCVHRITPEQKTTLDLSSWTVACNGAEPVRAATLRRFTEAFAECGFRAEAMYPTYGLAESTLLVSGGDREGPVYLDVDSEALRRNQVVLARPSVPSHTLVGCGRATPDHRVEIVDPQTRDRCPADRVGEIWVAGPSVAAGYFGRVEDTDQTFRAKLRSGEGPFLRTGDLGFIRAGELFVTGRLKDLCIIRGRNIYPQDVEWTVGQCHEALQPGAGAAFTVEENGVEQLVIVHEVKHSHLRELDPEPVFRAIVQAVVEQHEVKPTAVVLLRPGGLLRTSSGKVRRQPCREAYLTKKLQVVAEKNLPPATCVTVEAGPPTAQGAIDFIARCLDMPASELNLNQPLESLPIDSLKAFELKVSLEDAYQVKLPLTIFAQSPTLRDFLGHLGVPLEPVVEPQLPAVPANAHQTPVQTQFSLFYFSSQAAGNDLYRLYIDGACFADEHDFTAVWTPERHFHEFGGLFPNPAVLATALAMVTRRIRIRAGSVVLPLNDPIRVAEEWAVVDHLSGGRVDMAFATGWNPNDFVLAPQNFAARRDIMLEGIRTVQSLWRGEPVQRLNAKREMASIRTFPQPVQRSFTPWITCSGGVERFQDAGRCGGNVLTALLFQTIDELAAKIRSYRAARAEVGLPPETGHVTLMLHTFLGTDPEAVRRTVHDPFVEYLRSSVDLWGQAAQSLPELSPAAQEEVLGLAFERYYNQAGLFGTPESVAGRIRQLAAAGVNEIACLIDFGIPTAVALEGLKNLDQLRREFAPAIPSTNGVAAA